MKNGRDPSAGLIIRIAWRYGIRSFYSNYVIAFWVSLLSLLLLLLLLSKRKNFRSRVYIIDNREGWNDGGRCAESFSRFLVVNHR